MIVKRSNLDVVFFPGVHPQHHHWHAGGDAGKQNIPEDRLAQDYLSRNVIPVDNVSLLLIHFLGRIFNMHPFVEGTSHC